MKSTSSIVMAALSCGVSASVPVQGNFILYDSPDLNFTVPDNPGIADGLGTTMPLVNGMSFVTRSDPTRVSLDTQWRGDELLINEISMAFDSTTVYFDEWTPDSALGLELFYLGNISDLAISTDGPLVAALNPEKQGVIKDATLRLTATVDYTLSIEALNGPTPGRLNGLLGVPRSETFEVDAEIVIDELFTGIGGSTVSSDDGITYVPDTRIYAFFRQNVFSNDLDETPYGWFLPEEFQPYLTFADAEPSGTAGFDLTQSIPGPGPASVIVLGSMAAARRRRVRPSR